jgi:hypothetical protein
MTSPAPGFPEGSKAGEMQCARASRIITLAMCPEPRGKRGRPPRIQALLGRQVAGLGAPSIVMEAYITKADVSN